MDMGRCQFQSDLDLIDLTSIYPGKFRWTGIICLMHLFHGNILQFCKLIYFAAKWILKINTIYAIVFFFLKNYK